MLEFDPDIIGGNGCYVTGRILPVGDSTEYAKSAPAVSRDHSLLKVFTIVDSLAEVLFPHHVQVMSALLQQNSLNAAMLCSAIEQF